MNPYLLQEYSKLQTQKPHIDSPNVRVWTIKQDDIIRVNLVEMKGELSLHSHPDADHSLMVLSGKVKVQIGDEFRIIEHGDFISIPANVPHKYWSLTEKSMLVSMDAPYYDPAKTINH